MDKIAELVERKGALEEELSALKDEVVQVLIETKAWHLFSVDWSKIRRMESRNLAITERRR